MSNLLNIPTNTADTSLSLEEIQKKTEIYKSAGLNYAYKHTEAHRHLYKTTFTIDNIIAYFRKSVDTQLSQIIGDIGELPEEDQEVIKRYYEMLVYHTKYTNTLKTPSSSIAEILTVPRDVVKIYLSQKDLVSQSHTRSTLEDFDMKHLENAKKDTLIGTTSVQYDSGYGASGVKYTSSSYQFDTHKTYFDHSITKITQDDVEVYQGIPPIAMAEQIAEAQKTKVFDKIKIIDMKTEDFGFKKYLETTPQKLIKQAEEKRKEQQRQTETAKKFAFLYDPIAVGWIAEDPERFYYICGWDKNIDFNKLTSKYV
jgi:hypothetical protein